MKSIFVLVTVSFTSCVIAGCENRNIKSTADILDNQSVVKKSPRDSLYGMFFGSNNYLPDVAKFSDTRIAGEHKIPLTKYIGTDKLEETNRQLQLSNGYYSDTIEAGIIHKYHFSKTIAWINSASLFAFVPTGDTVKLCGEGYFETTNKPLTILIEDTIKVIANKYSKLNLTAYKTPLQTNYLTELAMATLVKGEFTVINGTTIQKVKAPHNLIKIFTKSNCQLRKAWNTGGATSWTKLKLDYKGIGQNELIERLGRRFNLPVETREDLFVPIDFTADFNEPLQEIVNRLNTLNSYFNCRLVNEKIVISHQRGYNK